MAYALQVILITYSYIFEPDNMTKGFNRTIDAYCASNYDDMRVCSVMTGRNRANLHLKYGPKNSH